MSHAHEPIAIGLELNNAGRVIAWALDYPGCFAYGETGAEAVIAAARALVTYEDWINRRAGENRLQLGDFDVRMVETWTVYTIDKDYEAASEGYEVESFFRHDWKPLGSDEAAQAVELLTWARGDLLHTVQDLSGEQLDRTYPGERWSIRGVLKHVANAEWWYLERLGLAGLTREQMPADVLERLAVVRGRLMEVLPTLAGQELVVGRDGELWSPRKLVRRALWHELDHVQHILKLVWTV